jgi:formate dehydrogenase
VGGAYSDGLILQAPAGLATVFSRYGATGPPGFALANEPLRQRLAPFNCKELLYYDYSALPAEAASGVKARRVEDLKDFVSQCDVVTVNCPLHEGTRGLVNADLLKHFKKGAWLVNTARGAICDKDDVAAAVKSGQINGYAGDVWNVQPAPKDHPWRTVKNPLGGGNGMVPHYSGQYKI